jgi:hypothetical protein
MDKYYNFDTIVSYDNDESYRKVLGLLMGFDYSEDKDDDFDENCYDNNRVVTVLDQLWFWTKEHPLFYHVYEKAASFMLSENPEIGLSVLMSYDNLPLFHNMLVAYWKLGERFGSSHSAYVELHDKLFK